LRESPLFNVEFIRFIVNKIFVATLLVKYSMVLVDLNFLRKTMDHLQNWPRDDNCFERRHTQGFEFELY